MSDSTRSSGTDDAGSTGTGERTGSAGTDDGTTGIRWHRDREDRQLLLSVEDDRVQVAVAFDDDVDWPRLRAVLEERDRELRHFLETRDGGGADGADGRDGVDGGADRIHLTADGGR
jgi:hypothetical protein